MPANDARIVFVDPTRPGERRIIERYSGFFYPYPLRSVQFEIGTIRRSQIDMSYHSKDAAMNRAKRTALLAKTKLRDDSGKSGDARVRNLSEKGLGGVTDTPLEQGQKMTITLNGIGPVKGHVAWVKGKAFGMTFDTPIDPDALTLSKGTKPQGPERFTVASRFQPVKESKRPSLTYKR